METKTCTNFSRYGRSYHLKISTSEDLRRVVELDEAHWVATGAPISTINCDGKFLRLLDTDKNGRISCHEVKEAILWLLKVLSDHGGISEGHDSLNLEAISGEEVEGRRIRGAAEKILRKLGQGEAEKISLDEVRRIRQEEESTPVSEAGVVLPGAAQEKEIAEFIGDVVTIIGGIEHPSGAEGINQGKLDEFLGEAEAHLQWHEQGKIPSGQSKTEIMPLGHETPARYKVLTKLRDKIDQYFAQCTVLALGEHLSQRMGLTEEELGELDLDEPSVIEEVLRKACLAKPRVSVELSFEDKINPAYAETLEEFRCDVAAAVLGGSVDRITAQQWEQIKGFFRAHQEWLKAKPKAELERLGVEKVQTYLDERFRKAVGKLIEKSAETAFVLDNIRLAEKVLLYQRYMIELANNFVSFPHLYDPASRAVLEMGSLVMDGRRFNLAVKAVDRTQHAKIAKTSNMYVIYAEIVPKDSGQKYEVAVPVTWGTKGNLCVGKRGVFYDLAGIEADARVVEIIENPISLGEALVSPFQRLGRMLTGKIESITAKAEKSFDAQAASSVTQATTTAPMGGNTGGMLLGGGLAIAALGSSLAYITKTLANTHPVAILIGVMVAVLLVMIPVSVVAYMKLRRRDLSAILEGSGWAINARMRLTRRQGKTFTQRPSYPKGAKGVPRTGWRWVVAAVVVLVVLAGGGYAVRGCLKKSDQDPVSQPAAAEGKAEEGEIDETPK